MNRHILEQPFAAELIRQRRGTHGKSLSYVEGAEYVRRLNEALEGNWSFDVMNFEVRDAEVVVLGRLSTNGVSKMAFGGTSITVSRDGEIVSVADDLKAACTDALKKAASLMGVGLSLYQDGQPLDPKASTKPTSNGANGQSRQHRESSGNGDGNGNGRQHGASDRITQRQLSAIWSMGRKLGQSADQIRDEAMRRFGVQPEFLAKHDASTLITELGEALAGP
ncbi:MAG: hypothetical protein KC503_34025 [Myxococcales bacterium]|nr:hypothetical protein [Myxococcales bacterium]